MFCVLVQKESHVNQNLCKLAELRLKSEGFLVFCYFAGAGRYFEINCCFQPLFAVLP